jgi:hypothetical protein
MRRAGVWWLCVWLCGCQGEGERAVVSVDAGIDAPDVGGEGVEDVREEDGADVVVEDVVVADVVVADVVVADVAVEDVGPDVAVGPCAASLEEPNDSAEAAYFVEEGRGFALEGLLCGGEEDWFAWTVPAGESLTVWIGFSHEVGDLDMRLWRGGEVVQVSESASDEERIVVGPVEAEARVLLEVYGFRGAEGPYTVRSELFGAGAGQGEVRVEVWHEDRPYGPEGLGAAVEQPSRHVRVEVVRSLDGAVVGSGWTDAAGVARVRYEEHAGQSYAVRALSLVEEPLGGRQARVRDRSSSGALYALRGAAWSAGSVPGEGQRLVARAEGGAGGAFHIADVAVTGLAFVSSYSDKEAPRLDFRWQAGRAFDCGSCYGEDVVMLGGQVEDTDEYDDVIILHEFGHWFVHRFSDDDSPAGPHRDRQVSPRLAYGEGLAYFFAGMVLGDPVVVDTFLESVRVIDLEAVTQNGEALPSLRGTSDGTLSGAHREEIVAGVLWDALDEASEAEGFDQVSIGVDGHMEVLLEAFGRGAWVDVGPPGIELSDWLGEAYCRWPELQGALPLLAEDRGYPWSAERDVGCQEKGAGPRLWRLEARGGWLWLEAQEASAAPGVVRVYEGLWPGAASGERVCAKLPCLIGAAPGAWGVVSVTAPGAPGWAGASWVGAQVEARPWGGAARSALSSAGSAREFSQ